MHLQSLSLTNFRNLTNKSLEFTQEFTCITGENGSGKTSILEAIYYLGHARSFRTQQLQRIAQYGQSNFVLHAKLIDQYGLQQSIGIERQLSGEYCTKISTDANKTSSDLAALLPILLIHPNSYHLLDQGAKLRRQFIDWGLFHVEPSFLSLWKRLNRILKQRNVLLREGSGQYSVLAPWDSEFIYISNEINKLRAGYLEQLIPLIKQILEKMTQLNDLHISYQQGWNKEESLDDILQANYLKDFERGYTYHGVHRADLSLKIGKHPVDEVLSRGQQKLLVIAMRLAQGLLLKELTGKNCIYLLDDITAELDEKRRDFVISVLKELDSQVFITAIDAINLNLPAENTQMFHVEHGSVYVVSDVIA